MTDPTNQGEIDRVYEALKAEDWEVPLMMRAWCPICGTWKEPLLGINGTAYFGDELS